MCPGQPKIKNACDDTLRTQPHRQLFDAVVIENRPLCQEHFQLHLQVIGHFPKTQPGQFIQLGCRPPQGQMDMPKLLGQSHCLPGQHNQPMPRLSQLECLEPLALLRRPFSLARRGENKQGTWIDIIGRQVGVGTRWLANLSAGDPVDFIGPLGHGFVLPAGKSLGLLVGGGVGLPPMFYLAEQLTQSSWEGIGFVGAQSDCLLPITFQANNPPSDAGLATACVKEFADHGLTAVVTTDDGSMGKKGLITDGLAGQLEQLSAKDLARAVVFTCGPTPMMQAVCRLARQYHLPCQVCLEQAMACGMSTCQSCVVKIVDSKHPQGRSQEGQPWRYQLACTAGPVFDGQDVVWQ